MRRLAQCALVAVLGVGAAGRLSAQALGIPYYVNPRGGTGLMAAANLGITSSPSAAKGKAYGLTGGIGAGPLFLTASVSQFNPDGSGSNITSYGATAGMKLFGGPLIPVSIGAQAGVGYFSQGSGASQNKLVSIPVALGVGLNVPLFPIKPWIAPRVQFNRVTALGTSSNETRTGFSVGADFNLLLGLGVHAAYDQLFKKGSSPSTGVFGVGAHFNFHVPMM